MVNGKGRTSPRDFAAAYFWRNTFLFSSMAARFGYRALNATNAVALSLNADRSREVLESVNADRPSALLDRYVSASCPLDDRYSERSREVLGRYDSVVPGGRVNAPPLFLFSSSKETKTLISSSR